jgi:hypothetical protein
MTLNNGSTYTFGDQSAGSHSEPSKKFEFGDKGQIRILKVCYNKQKDLTGLIFYD